jgi:sugar phosphate isomerase/epimerase
MKLAISNIAWAPEDAPSIYRLMTAAGVRGLEIAPALIFPAEDDPFVPSSAAVSELMSELSRYGITMVSMQSLLFGVADARLFGDADAQARFEKAMLRAIRLAEMLEIGNLVFGSPTTRCYPSAMSAQDAEKHALAVFQRLGDAALAAGTTLAIEPNPAVYGTNFLTTVESAAQFVRAAEHPGIALNFDMGALIVNGETNVEGLFESADGRVSHVHLSEPQLAPAPADIDSARGIVAAVTRAGFDGWFSIEMRRPEENALITVEAAIARGVAAVSNVVVADDA